MISIIISSANSALLADVIENIGKTIGVAYEVLSFENSDGAMGMCEVYNKGAQKAKYDILCYMHEDLSIMTGNWGKEVVKIFRENKKVGVIGVAGSVYKSHVPSGWYAYNFKPNLTRSNFIQAFKRSNKSTIHIESNPEEVEGLANVACIDGMWFCTLKSISLKYPFDEQIFRGFHCYDIDYCLSIIPEYDIVVTYNILMEHFSEGGYDQGWLDDTMKLHAKWANILPFSVVNISAAEHVFLEKMEYKKLLQKLIVLNYSFFEIASFLHKLKKSAGLKDTLYFKLLYYSMKFRSEKQQLVS